MATFPEKILGILLFCGCVMVIGVIQVKLIAASYLYIQNYNQSLLLFYLTLSFIPPYLTPFCLFLSN